MTPFKPLVMYYNMPINAAQMLFGTRNVAALLKLNTAPTLSRCEFIIAGGFVRDVFHGLVPKDVDIVAIQAGNYREWDYHKDSCAVRDVLKRLGFEKQDEFDTAGTSNPASCMYMVEKYTGGAGPDVDMLYYTERTLDNAVAQFDYNFNQFYIKVGANVNGLQLVELWGPPDLGKATRLRQDLSLERINRMEKVRRLIKWR